MNRTLATCLTAVLVAACGSSQPPPPPPASIPAPPSPDGPDTAAATASPPPAPTPTTAPTPTPTTTASAAPPPSPCRDACARAATHCKELKVDACVAFCEDVLKKTPASCTKESDALRACVMQTEEFTCQPPDKFDVPKCKTQSRAFKDCTTKAATPATPAPKPK